MQSFDDGLKSSKIQICLSVGINGLRNVITCHSDSRSKSVKLADASVKQQLKLNRKSYVCSRGAHIQWFNQSESSKT